MRIAVTGANGFVGRELGRQLCANGHDVLEIVRSVGEVRSCATEYHVADDNFLSLAHGIPEIGQCDAFVHLAARVHVMRDHSADSLALYRAANVEGTLNAAAAALRAGARRMLFVSSIKALGEVEPGRPWREDDVPSPVDPYGISKLEAEKALIAFGCKNSIEIIIVRPPLVYGPDVRANFRSLMHAISRGVPLPLGRIDARRSMVFVGNLADAIRVLVTRTAPTGGIFHVSDCDDLSVTGMAQVIARALHKKLRLIPVPVFLLQLLGRVTGRKAQVDRLTGSLRLDVTRLHGELGWTPPWTVSEGIEATVRAYETSR